MQKTNPQVNRGSSVGPSYLEAQELVSQLFTTVPPGLACSFYDRDAPIYTMSRFLPPSKVQDADISNSILGDGCVVRAGSVIRHSVIGIRYLISERCTIEDALIMGSDYYETMEECDLIPGCLPMGLGMPSLLSELSSLSLLSSPSLPSSTSLSSIVVSCCCCTPHFKSMVCFARIGIAARIEVCFICAEVVMLAIILMSFNARG